MGVKVTGFEKLDRAFRELQSAFERPIREFELREPLTKDFHEMEREQFDTEGHGRWPEVSPGYAKFKEINYSGKPLMRATDTLYNALTRDGADGAEVEVKDDSITFALSGEAGKRAAAHARPRGKRPARRVIDPTPKDAERFAGTIRKQAAKKIKGLSFK